MVSLYFLNFTCQQLSLTKTDVETFKMCAVDLQTKKRCYVLCSSVPDIHMDSSGVTWRTRTPSTIPPPHVRVSHTTACARLPHPAGTVKARRTQDSEEAYRGAAAVATAA